MASSARYHSIDKVPDAPPCSPSYSMDQDDVILETNMQKAEELRQIMENNVRNQLAMNEKAEKVQSAVVVLAVRSDEMMKEALKVRDATRCAYYRVSIIIGVLLTFAIVAFVVAWLLGAFKRQ